MPPPLPGSWDDFSSPSGHHTILIAFCPANLKHMWGLNMQPTDISIHNDRYPPTNNYVFYVFVRTYPGMPWNASMSQSSVEKLLETCVEGWRLGSSVVYFPSKYEFKFKP
jgi:hypothetical protein